MNKVRINQGRVLESGQRYLISLLLVGGMVSSIIYMNNLAGFILLIVLSSLVILLWTSFHLLEIDPKSKTYGEFTSVLGRKFGRAHSFDGIERIYLDRVEFGSQNEMVEYDAYVKFTNGEKLFLVSDEDEKELKKRLKPVIKKLGVEIEI